MREQQEPIDVLVDVLAETILAIELQAQLVIGGGTPASPMPTRRRRRRSQ